MKTVVLALGTNVGARRENLREAVRRLSHFVQDVMCSHAVETKPVDCAGSAPSFLNAAIIGKTDLEPPALLAACQAVEREMGRPEVRPHHADRIIDVDILVMQGLTFSSDVLTVPHPRMHERDFVMHPVAEIAPDLLVGPACRPASQVVLDVGSPNIIGTDICF